MKITYNSQTPAVICLTGQMAAGKNYICSLLENENCVSTDLDKTVHKALENKELCQKINSAFEQYARIQKIELLDSDGRIIRKNLGRILFNNPELLPVQERLVYPFVIEETKKFIEENKKLNRTVIINATLLYKTPELLEQCDSIYFVRASFFKRLFRARRRDGLSFCQIIRRFKTQKNLLAKYKASGKEILVIWN